MHHATDTDWLKQECERASSFEALVSLAMTELRKFPDGAEIICGPITTGGRGSIEANIAVFDATINALKEEGRPIFSQVPYENRISYLRDRWEEADETRAGQYCMPILEEVYRPLFETGLIRKAWFIAGWESSFGARWERERLAENDAEIEDLSVERIDRILAS